MSSEVNIVGLAVSPIAAPFLAVGAIGYDMINNAKEISKIVVAEHEVNNEIVQMFQNMNRESSNEKTLTKMIDKIINYFNVPNAFISSNQAREIIEKEKDIKSKYDLANNLLKLQSSFDMLTHNIETLNDVSEKTDQNIDQLLYKYDELKNIKKFNYDKIKASVDELNKEILNKFDSLKDLIEEQIKNKKFDKRFLQVIDVPQNIIPTIFNNEISLLLDNCNNDNNLKKLANEKKSIELLYKVYDLVSTLQNLEGFEEEADNVLRLFGSCIKLYEKEDISLNDYSYELDLKIMALENILKEINKRNDEKFELKRRFNIALAENNKLRSIMYLKPVEIEYNAKLCKKIIEDLETENEQLIKEYKSNALARHISTELKRKFINQNYKYIPSDREVKTAYTTIHKSYFVTPDGKNILCLNVNKQGEISEKVVGVKVFGLTDDKKSIFEAQQSFCEHNRKIINELFEEIDVDLDYDDQYIEKPSINEVYSEDFSGIIPNYVLNSIREKKLKKNEANNRVRRVH